MPLVRYKATQVGPYHGPTGTWMPGDVKEVTPGQAQHLLGPLADWFEAVEAPSPVVPEKALNGAPRSKPVRGKVK